jgi:shikimate kinase
MMPLLRAAPDPAPIQSAKLNDSLNTMSRLRLQACAWTLQIGPKLVYGGLFVEGAVTTETAVPKAAQNGAESRIVAALGPRSVVLVGMMGAGKSSIGRRLAARLVVPFVDADSEIEAAAGMTIPEIFAKHGEPYFRAGEARVIARLLDAGPQVLATGGGAVMDPSTRQLIASKSLSVWLKADVEVLLRRTKRRGERPLVDQIKTLLPLREPFYALADLTVQSREEPHDAIVEELVTGLSGKLGLVAEGAQ